MGNKRSIKLLTAVKSRTLVLTIAAICLFSEPSHSTTGIPVTAADLSTATCNVSYFESLKSRAWLEAQRRTRQAQNYILKPDSVLDYSCFSILNNISAEETEQIFSETHAGHCFPDSLDCSLDRLVISALTPYLNTNFNHTFLGGRSNLSRAAYDPDNTTMCTVMRDVWQLAKCHNFMPVADQDGFLSFQEYASIDPRRYPQPCTSPTNVPAHWTTNITRAFTPTGGSSWHNQLVTSMTTTGATYLQYLGVGNTTTPPGPGCGTFIRTGLTIIDQASIFYTTPRNDGVCTNPACSPNASYTCVEMTF